MTSFRTARLALVALALAVSCKSGDGGVADVLVISRVDVEPGITQVILGQSLQLSATPRTASGISVPGRNVIWSSSDPLIATVSTTGMVNGVALGGPVRIRATVDGVVGDALVTVRSVPVDRVTVTPANSGVLVGAGVQLNATAFDAQGTQLPGREFDWESSEPAIAAVTTTGIVIGLAQGGPVTITARAEGKSGSALVSVSTRPATRLAFAEQPGPAVAGAPLTPPIRILLQDDLLTTVIGAANPVTISLAGNPAGATLGGTTTINATSGVATFNNLTLDRPGTGYTFLVTSPGLSAATSTPFNVAVGAPAKLAFSTPLPGSAQSGAAFAPQPVLQLTDANGNLVAQSGVAVTAALASGSGTLSGTTTATTNSTGAAAFSDLALSGPAGSYTVSFSAPNLSSITGLVTLGAGVAQSLAIAVQPTSSAQSGVALTTQPAIQLKDAAGNNVGQAGVVITASIASGTGTLGGATTATTNNAGLAQFASLAINGASGNYTLGFSAPGGITGVTSSTIVLGAGAPTQLSIVTQPSAAAQSGVALATQPSLRLLDGGGNPVAVAGIQVTASIASGGGTLSGTATATTNASGVAAFTNLAISGTVGPRTLGFASAGLTSATSGTITLSAGPAAALGLNTQPSPSGSSGVALAQQPVVQIRDAAGNPVSQNGVLVTATIASGPAGATLGGNVATTAGFGAATFTSLAITGPSGTYTIQFSAPGLTSVTSGGVTLGAGAATQLFIATQPSATAQSGAALAQQPQIQLRDASNNPVAQSGVVVTAAIASGGGTLGGSTTATTNASGLATFTNLSISGVVGGRTLGFSAPGLAGATSGTITLSAGAASQLSITTQPSNLAQSGVPFTTQPVIQLRDAAGNAVSQAGTNVTVAIASGGGALGGTTTVATSASGVASFAGLSITGTAGDRTLGFTAPGLTGATSAVVSITAGAPSNLAITTQPSSTAQNGVAFAQQPAIALRDASNNPVSQAGVVVTAVIASGGGTLGGTTTATTDGSGIATFTNLSITGTTGARTLSFSAPSYNSVTSGTITLSAGAATQLVITTQPASSAQSGVVFAPQPVLQLRDVSGNNVSQAGVMVTAAIASGGGTLGGTTTVATSGTGVVTFAGLSISGTVGARTLAFSAPGLTGATSGTIDLSAGPASKLSITTQPSGTAQSGVAFPQQPAIQLRDAADNPVSQSGVAITASLASGPGGGTLNGSTIAATDGSGLATFTNLSLSGASGSYTLGFSAGSLTGTTSSAIDLSAGAGSKLAITTQPSATTPSGAVFAQQPVIQLQDGSGNPVADAGVQVTVTIQTGGGTLGGSTTATTNASGVASFTNLSITGTTGIRTLLFSAASYVSVASNDINVTAGAASPVTSTIAAAPTSIVADGSSTSTITVQLKDA
ncbi:MAG TPA: Ig-like domain-containing protein, partial [Gemmatimonadales bacterium]|nr:Ig-like domain-containing protein [Gemmatimonadales bacterium]